VCVSLPGYIVARLGHFDADKQKFLANLNVMLFTPCLSTMRLRCSPADLLLTHLVPSLHEARIPA
jgi:predicted permease